MPTLSQSPRTSRWLRRRAPSAERSSSSTAGTMQRPADGQPDRDRDEEQRAREEGDDDDREEERAEQRADAVERQPVGAHRADRPPWSISTSARAVAAWTRPRPRSVSAVPSATTKKTRKPPLSPPVSIPSDARRPGDERSGAAPRGPRDGISKRPDADEAAAAGRRYIRAEAETIWPQARRRASRSGAVGCQVAREIPKSTSASSAASTMSAGQRVVERAAREPPSRRRWRRRRSRSRRVPSAPPPGTA